MKNKAMLEFILLIVTMFTLSACGNSEDAASTEVISDEAVIQKIAETKQPEQIEDNTGDQNVTRQGSVEDTVSDTVSNDHGDKGEFVNWDKQDTPFDWTP